jgi:HTH-type transcriptional regulator, global nitrogen regulator NrpRI
MEKTQRHRSEILRVLGKSTAPATSARIAKDLELAGYQLSERTVRLYLTQLDEEGLTSPRGRRGHVITDRGLAELHAAPIVEGVGFLSAKIDQMTFNMSFDLATRTGTVVVNLSLVNPRELAECADQVCEVFAKGYAMGNRIALLAPGETLGTVTVPPGRVGFCTVCSITLNGVLLKHGVPTASRFGGLLEVREGRPLRFVQAILYEGTTIDPLEVFSRSGMTNYLGAIRNGNGLIGASFRELPADSRELVLNMTDRLIAVGLGGLLEVGLPGHPLLGQAVNHGRLGAVIAGGLNPIAILDELGHRVESRALAGLLDYHRLFPYDELAKALKASSRVTS